MPSEWRYRSLSFVGTILISVIAFLFASSTSVQLLVSSLSFFPDLPVVQPTERELLFKIGTATVVVVAVFAPLYKPRPRRVLDTVSLTIRRAMLAIIVVAAISYFDYSYRVPRITVLIVIPPLTTMLTAWFVFIRRNPVDRESTVVIVGDDFEQIRRVSDHVGTHLIGHISPPNSTHTEGVTESASVSVADSGTKIGSEGYVSGLSRLEDVLIDYDVDTAVLAFSECDRQEFFGALNECHEHGVTTKIHRDYAAAVLTNEMEPGAIVEIDLTPWDWQDRLTKRLFDIAFAVVSLLVLLPVILLIVVAIKLNDGGKILYSQIRTATFGDTFKMYKFRSMVENAESATGPRLSDDDRGENDSGSHESVGCSVRHISTKFHSGGQSSPGI